jgi:hypothetical protein
LSGKFVTQKVFSLLHGIRESTVEDSLEMLIGWSVMMSFAFRLALAFSLVEASILLLVEGNRVWIAVGAAAANVRVRDALVELVVGIGFCLIAESAYVEISGNKPKLERLSPLLKA